MVYVNGDRVIDTVSIYKSNLTIKETLSTKEFYKN